MFKRIREKITLLKHGRLPGVGDKEFQEKFLEEVYLNIPPENFKKNLREWIVKILPEQTADKRTQTVMAARAFLESLEKLYVSYAKIREMEWQIHYFWKLNTLRGADSSKKIQESFVERSESFAQILYSTTSSLIKLLSHLIEHEKRRGMRFGEITGFLVFLEGVMPDYKKDIATLHQTAHEFRGKFIDHPNQHSAFNWYAANCVEDKVRIIYYSQEGETKQLDITKELESPFIMMTAFKVSSVFIPPHHADVLSAFIALGQGICRNFAE